MPDHPIRVAGVLVVAAALVAACGQMSGRAMPRNAVATDDATTSPTSTPDVSSATPTVALPPRPREIHLESSGDPCALLNPAQQQRFGMNRLLPEDDTGFGHPGCTYKIDAQPPWHGFTVTPKPDLDARRLLTAEFDRRAKVVSAAGFPAVESRPGLSGDTNLSCFVNVDVADGQSLEVQSLLISTEAFTSDEMCEKTRQVAEAAMNTLLSRQ